LLFTEYVLVTAVVLFLWYLDPHHLF